jgi:hypothetical protein
MSLERSALDDAAPGPVPGDKRLLPLLLGWVLAPLSVAAGVVLVGVHLGASRPDAWYTELVRWLVHFFR